MKLDRMDSMLREVSLMLNMMVVVDMDRSCLEVHMGNSFVVECRTDMHLGVGMDRNW
jgi:hypothetical protein